MEKLHVSPDSALGADPIPFADQSTHVFTADRIQYILITNTASLYSMVRFGRGISDAGRFLDQLTRYMCDFICATGHSFIFERLMVLSIGCVSPRLSIEA